MRTPIVTHTHTHTLERNCINAKCNKPFSHAGVLNDHIMMHTGEKSIYRVKFEWYAWHLFEWAIYVEIPSNVKINDFLWIKSAVTLRPSPPHQEGTKSLPVGGFVSQGFRHSPPHQEGTGSLPAGGFASPIISDTLVTGMSEGGCPLARWAEPNNPSVKKNLPPSRAAPRAQQYFFWLR